MLRNDFETLVLLMLAAILMMVAVGFVELFERLRQPAKVFVMHQGGKSPDRDDIPIMQPKESA